jgi:hypothetical protein
MTCLRRLSHRKPLVVKTMWNKYRPWLCLLIVLLPCGIGFTICVATRPQSHIMDGQWRMVLEKQTYRCYSDTGDKNIGTTVARILWVSGESDGNVLIGLLVTKKRYDSAVIGDWLEPSTADYRLSRTTGLGLFPVLCSPRSGTP